MEQTQNQKVNSVTLKWDLDLESAYSRSVISSAHYLTEKNIWVKFNENS